MSDQRKITPPEDAMKRAISVLNCEAMRLRAEADDWCRADSGNHPAGHIMRQDAAELDEVRAYLEQFVTRDPDGTP